MMDYKLILNLSKIIDLKVIARMVEKFSHIKIQEIIHNKVHRREQEFLITLLIILRG
jgi:hypothetical protein